MPLEEIETHPYLQLGQIGEATKLILGSFPVYECTNPDTVLKQQNRINEGTIRFFYGSVDSSFWRLYSEIIDNEINLPPNPNELLTSLSDRHIAIADTIISCQRHGYSSEDSKLIEKTWNRQGIQTLITNGVTKILCTSKGVLRDLEKQIISFGNNQLGQINNELSNTFQRDFITGLGGNNNQITNSVAKVFLIDNIEVSALAIPSPGSPQRQLPQFGFNGQDWQLYADNYFTNAFNWLNN